RASRRNRTCAARGGGLFAAVSLDLHAGLDRRALCDVHRNALLGEYRSAGLRLRGDQAPRADRRPSRKSDDEPALARRAGLRAEEDRRSRPLPRNRGRARLHTPWLLAAVAWRPRRRPYAYGLGAPGRGRCVMEYQVLSGLVGRLVASCFV